MKKNVSTNGIRRILCRSDLLPTEKIVYLDLYTQGIQINSKSNMLIHASMTQLALNTNISEKTVSKAINSLISKQLIGKLNVKDDNNDSHYFLNNGKNIKENLHAYTKLDISCMDKINYAKGGGIYHIYMNHNERKTIARNLKEAYRLINKQVYHLDDIHSLDSDLIHLDDAHVAIISCEIPMWKFNSYKKTLSARNRHNRITIILNSDTAEYLQLNLNNNIIEISKCVFMDLITVQNNNYAAIDSEEA